MTDIAYRPRSIAELVDASVQLFRRTFRELATLMALGYIPWMAAMTFFDPWTLGPEGELSGLTLTGGIVMLVAFLWLTVVGAACMVAASDRYLGREPDVARSLQRALRRAWPIIGASLIAWTLTGLGLILLVVPGLYFFARFAVASVAAVLEDRGVGEALSRATALSANRKLHILGAIGAVWLITFIILLTVAAVAGILQSTMLQRLAEAAVGIAIGPLVPVVTMMVYYDLRIRAEGFDVELMEQQLRTSPGPV